MVRQLEKFTSGPMLPRLAHVTLSEGDAIANDTAADWWDELDRKLGMTTLVAVHNADGAMAMSAANDTLLLPEGVWEVEMSVIFSNTDAAQAASPQYALVDNVDGPTATLYFTSAQETLAADAVADSLHYRDTKSVVITLSAPKFLTLRARNNAASGTLVARAGCQLIARKVANINES